MDGIQQNQELAYMLTFSSHLIPEVVLEVKQSEFEEKDRQKLTEMLEKGDVDQEYGHDGRKRWGGF